MVASDLGNAFMTKLIKVNETFDHKEAERKKNQKTMPSEEDIKAKKDKMLKDMMVEEQKRKEAQMKESNKAYV